MIDITKFSTDAVDLMEKDLDKLLDNIVDKMVEEKFKNSLPQEEINKVKHIIKNVNSKEDLHTFLNALANIQKNSQKEECEECEEYKTVSFGKALDAIRSGKIVTRKSDIDTILFAPVSNTVPAYNIHKMISFNSNIKEFLNEIGIPDITFVNQILKLSLPDRKATSYIPQTEDLFTDDWIIIDRH